MRPGRPGSARCPSERRPLDVLLVELEQPLVGRDREAIVLDRLEVREHRQVARASGRSPKLPCWTSPGTFDVRITGIMFWRIAGEDAHLIDEVAFRLGQRLQGDGPAGASEERLEVAQGQERGYGRLAGLVREEIEDRLVGEPADDPAAEASAPCRRPRPSSS